MARLARAHGELSRPHGASRRTEPAPRDLARMRYLLFLMAVLAVFAGCDLLDPAKVGDPVFGPPPPRKVVKAAPTDPNAKASDTAVVAPDGSPAGPNTAPNTAPNTGPNAGPN